MGAMVKELSDCVEEIFECFFTNVPNNALYNYSLASKWGQDRRGTWTKMKPAKKSDSYFIHYLIHTLFTSFLRYLNTRDIHASQFPKSIGAKIISGSAGNITGKYSAKGIASSRQRDEKSRYICDCYATMFIRFANPNSKKIEPSSQ